MLEVPEDRPPISGALHLRHVWVEPSSDVALEIVHDVEKAVVLTQAELKRLHRRVPLLTGRL